MISWAYRSIFNDHPFVIQLLKTFENAKKVYILTGLITGSELLATIRTIPVVLSSAQSQFFTGSLLLALESLHDRNIVFRNLKPKALDFDKNLWGKSPFEVAESVIRRQQNTSGQVLKQKCRNTVCVEFSATTQSCCERSLENINRVTEFGTFPLFGAKRSGCAEYCSVQPRRRRLFVMSQRNV